MNVVSKTSMLTALSRWIASGFGSGRAVVAPGTWGSAASVLLWWILQMGETEPRILFQVQAAVIVALVGWAATAFACRDEEKTERDPQWIVIDEWAGIFITLMCVAPNNFIQLLIGFVLFRVFDIIKPGPVRWAERLPGATGIMADDLVAGLLAFSVMRAVL
jgi:phosphatidylglycerophosphatase A